MHLVIQKFQLRGYILGCFKVCMRPQPCHSTHAQGGVAGRLQRFAGDLRIIDLWNMESPHARIQKSGDPLPAARGWPNEDGKIQRSRQGRHISDRFHGWRRVLHIDPGIVKTRTLEQGQNRWSPDQVDPGADLDFPRSQGIFQGVGSHRPDAPFLPGSGNSPVKKIFNHKDRKAHREGKNTGIRPKVSGFRILTPAG